MFKKLSKRIVACMLVAVITIGGCLINTQVTYASNTSIIVKKIDGVEYTITTTKIGDNIHQTIKGQDKLFELNYDGDVIDSTLLEKTNGGLFASNYKVVDEQQIDVDDIEVSYSESESQYSWNSKTKTPSLWGSEYWYQYGVSSYHNAYLQIGCKAKYRIKYYTLSSEYKADCSEYTDKVKECVKDYSKGMASAGLSTGGYIVSVIISYAGLLAVFPPAAVVTAAVAIVGGYATAIKFLIDSYVEYADARDCYTIIKTYGTKL